MVIGGASLLLAAVLVASGMAMVAFWVGLPGSRVAFEDWDCGSRVVKGCA